MGKHRTADMTNFETLIAKNDIIGRDRWAPHKVSEYECFLSENNFRGIKTGLRKNIAYSLQYLEFLQLQIGELKLHSVIETHIQKSYIIITAGIIESIFYFILKKSGNYKKEEWKVLRKPVHTNIFDDDGKKQKYTILLYEKLEHPEEGEMDFEAMINKVQDKKLISISGRAFPYIKGLKRLRNKVHLQGCQQDSDTDYLKICECDYLLARYILHLVLTCDTFSAGVTPSCLSFLCLSVEERCKVREYISGQDTYETL